MNAELAAALDEALARNWSADEVALRTRNAPLASWVKYLGRAKDKLPTWAAARCWIDERSYMQSSSEATAAVKFEGLSGLLAIDLTLGLGIDAAALAARFDRVVGVELDEQRAEAARFNFARLGISNIEVVCGRAEDISLAGADLVYVDPSRVDASGRRVYSLEQSSPDVLSMLDRFPKRTIIKLSPLFDVDEALRIFNAAVEVVSADGECKEVLVRLGEAPEVRCTLVGNAVRRFVFGKEEKTVPQSDFEPQFLYLPDAALVKARVVEPYLAQNFSDAPIKIDRNAVFSARELPDFAGRGFRIDEMYPYKPKALKKILKERGIGRAELLLGQGAPHSIEHIAKELGLKPGGEQKLFFGHSMCVFVSLPL